MWETLQQSMTVDGKHNTNKNGDDLGMVQMALDLPHYLIS